jgi:hypothetical protein
MGTDKATFISFPYRTTHISFLYRTSHISFLIYLIYLIYHVTLSLPVKKAPLGRIWRDFRLRMRRIYFRIGSLLVTWLTWLPVTSLGKSIFTSEVYTVFKVEYFLYIIQSMLQYTPSFNKVCTKCTINRF